jgi:hypothetical protein
VSTPTPIAGMMNAAQSSLSNPMASSVPSAGGTIDPSVHPVVAAIIKALAGGAGAYGWTSMPPQQRLEAQNLEAQKAEAMSRIGLQQQQLGLEGQRVGIEQGRLGEEQARTKIEAKRQQQESSYQTGMLGEQQKRTGIEAARQKAEAEWQQSQAGVNAQRLDEEIRFHKQQGTLEQNRLGIEAKMAQTAAARLDMEEKHFDQQFQAQGLQFNRQVAEDQRKALHESLDKFYQEHGRTGFFTGKDDILKQHQAIDEYINDKLSKAVPSGIPQQGGWNGWKPSQGVTAQPSQQQGQPVYQNGKQIGTTLDGKTLIPL